MSTYDAIHALDLYQPACRRRVLSGARERAARPFHVRRFALVVGDGEASVGRGSCRPDRAVQEESATPKLRTCAR
jgi:hypothetical protein